MDKPPVACKVPSRPIPGKGLGIANCKNESRDKERCIIQIVAWVFRGGLLSHMACENYSQAMPCAHVNTTLRSRQFSGHHDSSPLGLLLITAFSGYSHFC
ncbi:hypothetical protein N7524_005076 [Penicillium chrysogenum]|nr:hypothetical protein N7524_005076 [Penicillium chrysogenum]